MTSDTPKTSPPCPQIINILVGMGVPFLMVNLVGRDVAVSNIDELRAKLIVIMIVIIIIIITSILDELRVQFLPLAQPQPASQPQPAQPQP